MAKPVLTRVVDYLAEGTADLADSVERLNRDLDNRENNPRWSRTVLRDTFVILSPRRWIPLGKKRRSSTLDDLDAPIKPAARPNHW
ncbi:MAG: hypothetical protein J0I20_29595 [Chloroflexi bacterium]|nr:hypothetical protein [Chloroflexota bacterium]OJV95966.1 MAG: hypothetical protein BGO39_03790 [Chloroflexi bacterium 54-19]